MRGSGERQLWPQPFNFTVPFIFHSGGGHDVIKDFHASDSGHDIIDFSDIAGVQNFQDLKSQASQHGSDAVFDFGTGDTLTLHDANWHDLSAKDFSFTFD